jgi:hypothetical protein
MFVVTIQSGTATVTIFDGRGRKLQQFRGPVAGVGGVRNELVFKGLVEVSAADVAKLAQ